MRKLTDTMNLALDALYAIQSTCTNPDADKAWGIGSVAPGQDPNRSCRALVKRGVAIELDPDSGERRDGTGSFRLTEQGMDLGAERVVADQAEADQNAEVTEADVAAIMRKRAAKSATKGSVLAQLAHQAERERNAEQELVAPTKLGTVHRATIETKGASDSCAQWGGRTTTVATFDDLDDYQGEQQAAADAAVVAADTEPLTIAQLNRRWSVLDSLITSYPNSDELADRITELEQVGAELAELGILDADDHVYTYECQRPTDPVTVDELQQSVDLEDGSIDHHDLLLKVVKQDTWRTPYRAAGEDACREDRKGIRAEDGRTELFKHSGWKVA